MSDPTNAALHAHDGPPAPQDDIPALIRRWHANPTIASRHALWNAIIKHGKPTETGLSSYHRQDGTTYCAVEKELAVEGDHVIIAMSRDPSRKS